VLARSRAVVIAMCITMGFTTVAFLPAYLK
jgi:hypothetical protein